MSRTEKVWAVVPAAGTGERMQSDVPKQYLKLGRKAVLQHTLERLASHSNIEGIVLALAPEDSWWPQLNPNIPCQLLIAKGGKARSDSVLNALIVLAEHTSEDPWVLVHDAARPCLRHEDIDRMLQTLATHSVGGVLGMPVTDTVKRVDASNTIEETVCRNGLWRAATPQMFRRRRLTKALMLATEQGFSITDEASAIELAGWKPMMVEGHSDNIKITLPEDLAMAQLYLKLQTGES